MATRYWTALVGSGTGTWDASNILNWSATSGGLGGASAPTSADTVIFDTSSGAGAVTIGSGATDLTLAMTSYAGTLAFGTNNIAIAGNNATIYTGDTTYSVTGTPLIVCTYAGATGTRTILGANVTEANSISLNVTGGTDSLALGNSFRSIDLTGFAGNLLGSTQYTVYGDYKLSTGLTPTSNNGQVTFSSTSATPRLITTYGKTSVTNYIFDGAGGTWALQDNLALDITRTLLLTRGTLDLNGKTVSTGTWNSTNTNTRTLAFNGGSITITGNALQRWAMANCTGFTVTGTPTVNLTYSGATGTREIRHGSTGGATESNVVNFNISAGTDIILITAGSSLGSLNLTGFAGTFSNTAWTLYGNLTLAAGATYTAGTGALTLAATSAKTITSNGKTLDNPIVVNGIGGTFSFLDALTQGSTRGFTITNGTVKLKNGATSTVGVFGTSTSSQKFLQSTVDGSPATLSQASGTVTVNNLTIKDIAATGGATFTALRSNGNIDGGGNSGWNFGPPAGGSGRALSLGLGITL